MAGGLLDLMSPVFQAAQGVAQNNPLAGPNREEILRGLLGNLGGGQQGAGQQGGAPQGGGGLLGLPTQMNPTTMGGLGMMGGQTPAQGAMGAMQGMSAAQKQPQGQQQAGLLSYLLPYLLSQGKAPGGV